eukprot:TRINITY_DN67910_c0_g1_i1.p1 TRINITY_DN67910_c0_g1~~TRINITY_DN67910_c0_g1_i1.p1  ORF type:complete len:332 (-),score=49.86 TRINITY_DN67910_c0_g1_i1:15-1010(-)
MSSSEASDNVGRADGINQAPVELLCCLTDVEPFEGGTVAIAAHPVEFKLAVCVSALAKVLLVSTETGKLLSSFDAPEPFEDGPKSIAFDVASGDVVLVTDDYITRWKEEPAWCQVGPQVELHGDCAGISVDSSSRVLVDSEEPCWLLPSGSTEKVPLETRPPEPPTAEDGDTEAMLRHQCWEATTIDLSSALMLACQDGSIYFYSRDSKSVHFLAAGQGKKHATELSVRRARTSHGVVVHMESELPEDGCCCVDSRGGMYVLGPIGEELSDGLALWYFLPGQAPSVKRLHGFRCCPVQLDAVAVDGCGFVYVCVVEAWPDERAVYRVRVHE